MSTLRPEPSDADREAVRRLLGLPKTRRRLTARRIHTVTAAFIKTDTLMRELPAEYAAQWEQAAEPVANMLRELNEKSLPLRTSSRKTNSNGH